MTPAGRALARTIRRPLRALLAPLTRTRSAASEEWEALVVLVVDTEGDFGAGRGRAWVGEQVPRLSLEAYAPGGEVWRIFRGRWRERHRDAAGDPVRLTWFVRFDRQIEAAGKRDLVYRALRAAGGDAFERSGDEIAWHHHHLRWDGARWQFDGDYEANRDHEASLAAYMEATGGFPCAFRAGAYMETPTLHRWLGDYIPFDYSLVVGPPDRRRRDDPALGVSMDWSRAPNDWSFYRASPDDAQRPAADAGADGAGAPARFLFPTTQNFDYLTYAFAEARRRRIVVGASVHDYDALTDRLHAFLRRLAQASRAAGVGYRFATATGAARAVLGLDGRPAGMVLSADAGLVTITARDALFGPRPFAAAFEPGGPPRVLAVTAGERGWVVRVPHDARTLAVGAAGRSGGSEIAWWGASTREMRG